MARRAPLVVALFVTLAVVPRPASAERILGGVLLATGGDIIVQLQGNFAGAQSGLFIAPLNPADPNDPNFFDQFIFINAGDGGAEDDIPADAVGTTVNLATAFGFSPAAGTEVVFGLTRLDINTNTFFTGPPPGSGDSIAHALIATNPLGGDLSAPELALLPFLDANDGVLVGFEDKTLAQILAEDPFCGDNPFPGCEPDFNDLIYSFTGVRGTAAVPEPATLLLFGAGAAGVAWRRRRQR